MVTVTEVHSRDDESAWDEYVLGHPEAAGYHQIRWRSVVEAATGHGTLYLLARNERGQVVGVLPLVFLSSWLFGRFLVSMPFFNYGGVLADTPHAQRELLRVAVASAGELGAGHIELRHERALELPWPCRRHKVSIRMELPAQFETLWKGFPSKLRSQIRRAEREGVSVRVGGAELVDDFYRVFTRNMRDLGTPVYGRRFFDVILRSFPDEVRVCLVYQAQRPLAAGIIYGFREKLEIPWASSDRRYNRLAPNMLLYATALEYACQQGFRVFDFGRTTPGSGPCRFKEQWGGRPTPLYWYYWLGNGGRLPDLSPEAAKYRAAARIWRRLPIALTRALGPGIVKSIP